MSQSDRNNHTKHWIRSDKRLAIYLRDSFVCGYCGRDLRYAPPDVITLDHLVPRNAGGGNLANNLTTACISCNSSRQDKPWMDYATGGSIERINTKRVLPLNLALARAIMDGTVGNEEGEALR